VFIAQAGLPQDQVDGRALAVVKVDDVIDDDAVHWKAKKAGVKKAGRVNGKRAK
jgi:hypothetical protein